MRTGASLLTAVLATAALAGCGGSDMLESAPRTDPLAARGPALARTHEVLEDAGRRLDAALESPSGLPLLRGLLDRPDLDPALGGRAQLLARTLDDLLTRSRLDGSDGERAEWTVTPEALCRGSEACARELERVPLRLSAVSHQPEALEVELTAGDRPAGHLALRPGELEVVLDLDHSRALALLILDELPRSASGSIVLTHSNRGGAHHLEIALPRAVEITGVPFSVQLAPASPAISVDVDPAGTVSVDLALGAMTLSGLVPDFFPCEGEGCSAARPQRIDASLGSLTGRVELSNTGIHLRSFGVGNGPAGVLLDGMPLLTLHLNAMNGRTVSGSILEAGGDAQISVEPLLDAGLELHLRALAAAGVEVGQAWLRDMALSLHLEGPPRGVVRIPTGGGPMARVVSGRLTLREGDADPVVVEAGQCLDSGDDLDAPLFGAHATTCW